MRRMQDRAIADFFRFYLAPFHPYTQTFLEQSGGSIGRIGCVDDLKKFPFLSKRDLLSSDKEPEKARRFILAPSPEALRRSWPFRKQITILFSKDSFRRSFYPILMTATTGRTADPVPFIYADRDIRILQLAGRRLLEVFGLAYPDRALSFSRTPAPGVLAMHGRRICLASFHGADRRRERGRHGGNSECWKNQTDGAGGRAATHISLFEAVAAKVTWPRSTLCSAPKIPPDANAMIAMFARAAQKTRPYFHLRIYGGQHGANARLRLRHIQRIPLTPIWT